MLRVTCTLCVLASGLALAGCETFDPTAIFDAEIFNTKKKLPGERQPVFPEGTPGVSRGVPPELVKGYEAPAEAEPAPEAKPAEAKAKPKPNPKPKAVAKPKEEEGGSTSATARAASPPPPAQRSQQWPDPPSTQRQAPSGGAWPASSAQPGGQVAWPDPPAPR
jgi:hypothetical protein